MCYAVLSPDLCCFKYRNYAEYMLCDAAPDGLPLVLITPGVATELYRIQQQQQSSFEDASASTLVSSHILCNPAYCSCGPESMSLPIRRLLLAKRQRLRPTRSPSLPAAHPS